MLKIYAWYTDFQMLKIYISKMNESDGLYRRTKNTVTRLYKTRVVILIMRPSVTLAE